MPQFEQNTFQFGVCGHNPSHAICNGYPQEQTLTHLHLAAQLGVKLYRFDTELNNWLWMDLLVETAGKYGLDLMAIVYQADGLAEKMAARYRGKIKYYQICNEIDCLTFKKIPGVPDADGREIHDFDENKLADWADRCRRIAAELRRGDPEAKLCLNGTWKHTGMIDYMLANGVDFDILGWDWYSNMESYGIRNCVEDLLRYEKDIIFCETNIWPHTHKEEDRAPYLVGLMNALYTYPSSRLKGMIIYELMDEPRHPSAPERTFGLVRADEKGQVLGMKDAYIAIQNLLL